ncbi:hypothetical protein WMY93_025582 [Mugilogobius chulae]|uniref:Fucolectin tachylectin-4 pentraxin-1 domain-containing protein n=1 Tax=Mugilogobius chulae TaxID=88201 RepID=A0AAW0MV28_9GOBI
MLRYGGRANVALRGRATQSDTVDFRGGASNTIDGNRDSVYNHSSCTETSPQTSPWWRVDLLEPVHRHLHHHHKQGDCCPERLNGAEIRLGNTQNNNPMCAFISSIPSGGTRQFACDGMDGRYVTIVIPDGRRVLHMCEVEVYGSVLD